MACIPIDVNPSDQPFRLQEKQFNRKVGLDSDMARFAPSMASTLRGKSSLMGASNDLATLTITGVKNTQKMS